MLKIEGEKVFTKVTEGDLRRLEKIMKRHTITKAQALRNVLSMGLDVYEDLEKLGVPQTVALFDGLKGKLSSLADDEEARSEA